MNGNGAFREDELVLRKQKIDGEWVEISYPKLGGRLRVLHEQQEKVSITTVIVQLEPEFVVVRATVATDKGSFTGTGTASTQRDARLSDSLVELAESRAIARAARFAGVGVEYCSAEEVAHLPLDKPENVETRREQRNGIFSERYISGTETSKPVNASGNRATQAQVRALHALSKKARYTDEDVENLISPFNASSFKDLNRESASRLISHLQTEVAA
jgi:hypothetical protein